MVDNKGLKKWIADIKEATGLKQAEIAEKIGVKSTYLSDMANGRVPITTNVVTELSEQFHIEMSSGDNSDAAYNLVPVYNFDAVGGMNGSNDVTDAPAYIERHVPFPGARKDDICVHITGNSMIPTYCPGSLILVREVQDWREYFGYGHCFVLFLRDGRRILKEVQRFAEDPKEYVLCVSHNRDYPAEELPRNLIRAVYKVIMTYTNEGF